MHPVFVELLGNLQWMSLQEVNTPAEIIVCFTQSGKAAHALHIDCKPTLYVLSKRGSPHLTVVFFTVCDKAARKPVTSSWAS